MTKITRGWPPERRAKQALNCRKTKPWNHSTGPKTESGKKITKYNAVKHGLSSIYDKMLFKLLQIQGEFVKQVSKLRKTGYHNKNIQEILYELSNNVNSTMSKNEPLLHRRYSNPNRS